MRTSFHALSPAGRRVWRMTRAIVPRERRFFFEGSMDVRGQLWFAERKLLYDTVRRFRPDAVMEVGTWEGGGSTFFIAQALHANGNGVVHTIEADEARFAGARRSYEVHLPHLVPHVRFHHGVSTEVYPALLAEIGPVDAVFLDGAQDAEQTLSEFEMFEPALGPDAVLMMHDWDNEKMRLVRQSISGSPRWNLEERLTAPSSVGFAVFTSHQ